MRDIDDITAAIVSPRLRVNQTVLPTANGNHAHANTLPASKRHSRRSCGVRSHGGMHIVTSRHLTRRRGGASVCEKLMTSQRRS